MPAKVRQKALPPIKCGAVVIRRYRLADGRTMIAFPTATKKRQLRTFADATEARSEAERIARELHNGGAEAAIFSSADRADFSQARKDVAEWGLPVHVATSEWGEAKKAMRGSRHTFLEVVAAGLAALHRAPHPVPEVVAELLASKALRELNGRYQRGMASTLRKFADRHPGEIRDLSAAHLETFLASFAVGSRRRDNILNELRHLFEFARLRGYLPNEVTVGARVPKIHTRDGTISFFSVAEMRLLLENVRPEWLPFLAIASFAGIRTEEITRGRDAAKHKDPLRWSDFDWQEREIHVRKETAKIGIARIVPILDNLYEWLRPWRDSAARGPVAPASRSDREFGKDSRLERVINRALVQAPRLRDAQPVQLGLAGLAEPAVNLLTSFHWRHNALRHSYGSYRASVIKNMPQLADEMGNSVVMIQQHYRNPRPKTQALAWFAIRPTESANIVSFPDAATG